MPCLRFYSARHMDVLILAPSDKLEKEDEKNNHESSH